MGRAVGTDGGADVGLELAKSEGRGEGTGEGIGLTVGAEVGRLEGVGRGRLVGGREGADVGDAEDGLGDCWLDGIEVRLGAGEGVEHVPQVTGQAIVWPYEAEYTVHPGSFCANHAHVYVPKPKEDHVRSSTHVAPWHSPEGVRKSASDSFRGIDELS